MNEIPIRINLGVSESQQQVNLSVSESQHQVDLVSNSAVVTEKNYNQLYNKPSIDNVVLENNVTLQQLGLRNIYYDTKQNWNSHPDLIAVEGAIYIYKDYFVRYDEHDEPICSPALKIGDGVSYLIDMPIAASDVSDIILEHINDAVVHVSENDRTFWNNKSSAYLEPDMSETLVLSNTNFMLGGIIYNHG